MIDPRIIKLLDNNDVEIRKKAIKALAKTEDPQALPYLARVYREDRDPEVRELAKKGGLYIKKIADAAAAPPAHDDYGSYDEGGYDDDDHDDYSYDDPYSDDDDDDDQDEALPPPSSELKVSKSNEDLARSYLNQAMDANVSGDDHKATQLLQRALKTNPRLAYDSFTKSLAASVTGLQPDQAIRSLMAEKPKKAAGGGDISWGDVMIDLAIYMLVIVIGIFITTYFSLERFNLAAISAEIEGAPDFGLLTNLSIVFIALIAFVSGFFSIFALLLQAFGIHMAAVSFLGGDGSYKGLLRRIVPFNSIYVFVLYAVSLGIIFSTPDISRAFVESSANGQLDGFGIGTTNTVLSCLSGLISLVGLFIYSRLIGLAYDFNTLKGCFSLIIGTIILIVLYFLFICGGQALLFGLLATASP